MKVEKIIVGRSTPYVLSVSKVTTFVKTSLSNSLNRRVSQSSVYLIYNRIRLLQIKKQKIFTPV